MLKPYGFGFYEVAFSLERLRSSARIHEVTGNSYISPRTLYESDQEGLRKFLADMVAECENLQLTVTSKQTSFVRSEYEKKGKNYSYNDLLKDLNHLAFSFGNELRENISFRIADSKKDYFQRYDLFGLKVNTAFPSCVPEIENAGTCYALERNEACVFHCMRILERALRVLARELGVTFPGTLDLQNWQNIIESVETEIKNLEKLPKSKYKSQTLKLFSQAAMQFRWFKEAWRNHVMHGRDSYDEGRAHSILGHVHELMQALAEGGLAE